MGLPFWRHFAGTCGAIFFAAFAFFPLNTVAKTVRKDTVVMTNGDQLTGEVKGLQNGLLLFKVAYVSDNIGLDWNQVKALESSATFQITLVNGLHVKGTIKREASKEKGTNDFVVHGSSGELRVSPSDIAQISTQKDNFWQQLSGSIDAGYSFTSGNGQSTVNNDASATYLTPNWISTAALSTSFNGQSGAAKTNRIDGSFYAARFLSRNSYLAGFNEYLHSSQQDLNLRTTLGGGYGRYWIRTSNTNLRWLAGSVYTWESFNNISGQPKDSNVEGFFGVALDAYRFKLGEVHLQLSVFPGLSDAGRVRTTTNNSLKVKLTNNFYYTLGFWDNYDSRPPTNARNNELGISSSIGWSF